MRPNAALRLLGPLAAIFILNGTLEATTPLAHWGMDEGAGTLVGDSAGGYDGTAYGPTWISGELGGALSFDGVNDYVAVPVALDSDTFTVTGWVEMGRGGAAFSAAPATFAVYLTPNGSQIRFRVDSRNAGGDITWIAAGLPDQGWHLFAASFDSQTMRLYVDGILQASASVANGDLNSPSNTYIGTLMPGLGHFGGALDDVRYYDVALSDQEIADLVSNPGNSPPVVSAGPDRQITLPQTSVQLDGSVSDDGLPMGQLAVQWTVLSGTGASFSDPSAVDTTAFVPGAGSYVFALEASDGELSSSDTVTVEVLEQTVNQPPTVDVGSDLATTVGGSLQLGGLVADDGEPNPPGTTTVQWSSQSGPATPLFADAGSVTTTVTFPAAGTYVLRLTADDSVLSGFDELAVTVSPNSPPVPLGRIEAEDFKEGGEGVGYHDTTLGDYGGTNYRPGESVDIYADPSGYYVGHYRITEWLAYDVDVPQTGSYDVRLRLLSNVALTRQLSIQVDGIDVTGPFDIEVATPLVWFDFTYSGLMLTQGTHELRIRAETNSLSFDSFELLTTGGNVPPVVDVGPDLAVELPAGATLQASVTDDGQIYPTPELTWSRVSGPGRVTFSSPNAAATEATFTVGGTYVLRLTAFDGAEFGSDTLTATVTEASANQPPIAFDQFVNVTRNTPKQIVLDFEDSGGPAPYSFSYGTPGHGTLEGSGNSVVYTPDVGFTGPDSFGWTVSDGQYEATATVTISVNPPIQSGAIVIDHTDLEAFDRIPDSVLAAARNLNVIFSDRSVGVNLDDALDCFAYPSWESTPDICKRDYASIDEAAGRYTLGGNISEDPLLAYSVDPVKYGRANWKFEDFYDVWYKTVQDFISTFAPARLPSNDIVTFQLSYLNNDPSMIDPDCGFLATQDRQSCPAYLQGADIGSLEGMEAANPDKFFVYWTTSLPRMSDSVLAEFNDGMRQYAVEHGKILFDFADIEAHDPDGTPCYDSADGRPYYLDGTLEENLPDDGLQNPAICRRYTTETAGGHLGSISGGKVQVAKGFWILMSCIAGWDDPACGP